MERPALVVVEDATDRRAIVQDHVAGLLRRWRWDLGIVGRRPPLIQHRLLDRPQPTHLPPHLHLGVAVRLQHRLGQVAEEVVGAVPMRDAGELRGDPGHEGVLLVRHPELHRLAKLLGPLPGLGDQAADLRGGGREQRLGEPDPLAGQLPHDVQRLVALLGLEAIDREDQVIDRVVLLAEPLGVLLAGGEHRLVTTKVRLDGVAGEGDLVGVEELPTDLGDRPVSSEAAMADPAEDVPSQDPVGHGDGGLGLGADGPMMPRAARVGAMVELADQMSGTVEAEDVMMAMVADVHGAAADRARTVEDIEFPGGEVRLFGPAIGHGIRPTGDDPG